MRRFLAAVVGVVIVTFASGQTIHVVGPGGFAQINAAVAAAAPGDVIAVHPGTYQSFQVGRGMTIRAVTSGTVFVMSAVTVSCPAPEVAHLIGIEIPGLSVQNATCALDQCRIVQASLAGPALYAFQAHVVLQDCIVGRPGAPYISPFGASSHGLTAVSSNVTAVDTSFRGLDREPTFGTPASAGVYLMDSRFHGSRLAIAGGDGLANSTAVPGVGLGATGASPTWLTDSTVSGGRATDLIGQPPHACPVAATLGHLARCTLDPTTCPPTISTSSPGLGMRRLAPLASGMPFTIELQGEAHQLVGVWAAFGLGVWLPPEVEQPIAILPAGAIPLAALVTDGAGQASASWALPPGTANFTVWLQAAADGPLPLQASPVVGGVLR